jgi:glycosyltransferase involved in cell wall biosynthesis
MTPTLGIVIPSAGRATLRRTLESIAPQILPGDAVLVVGDTLDGPLPQTEAIVAAFPWCRYLSHAGMTHTHGHEQINVGLPLVGGDWLLVQDDDDVYCPDAFAAIRATIRALHRPRPLLFRFRSYHGGRVFWERRGLVAEGNVGGHCLCVPNRPGQVGTWGLHYQGDFTYIAHTLRLWEPVKPLWCEAIIAVARPS